MKLFKVHDLFSNSTIPKTCFLRIGKCKQKSFDLVLYLGPSTVNILCVKIFYIIDIKQKRFVICFKAFKFYCERAEILRSRADWIASQYTRVTFKILRYFVKISASFKSIYLKYILCVFVRLKPFYRTRDTLPGWWWRCAAEGLGIIFSLNRKFAAL